jgi:hypothetical protein
MATIHPHPTLLAHPGQLRGFLQGHKLRLIARPVNKGTPKPAQSTDHTPTRPHPGGDAA